MCTPRLKIMIDEGIWHDFFSNGHHSENRKVIETLFKRFENYLKYDLIRFCITSRTLERLCIKFEDPLEAASYLKSILDVIEVEKSRVELETSSLGQGLDSAFEIECARSHSIPLFITQNPIVFTDSEVSPLILSPAEILTIDQMAGWFPLLETKMMRKVLRPILGPCSIIPPGRDSDYYLDRIKIFVDNKTPATICTANVNLLMEVHRNEEFAHHLSQIDLITPSGIPLVWMLRLMGARQQQRVTGIELMQKICEYCHSTHKKVYLICDELDTLNDVGKRIRQDFPNIEIVGQKQYLNSDYSSRLFQEIVASKADLILVSLPSLLQERWLSENRIYFNGVVIAVGRAFKVFSGKLKRAPSLIQTIGLEWFYFLAQDPSYFYKIYRYSVPKFIWMAFKKQVMRSKLRRHLIALPASPRVEELLYHICAPNVC